MLIYISQGRIYADEQTVVGCMCCDVEQGQKVKGWRLCTVWLWTATHHRAKERHMPCGCLALISSLDKLHSPADFYQLESFSAQAVVYLYFSLWHGLSCHLPFTFVSPA